MAGWTRLVPKPMKRRVRAWLVRAVAVPEVLGSPAVQAELRRQVDQRLTQTGERLAQAERRSTDARRRADDAHRLAVETSRAVEHLLQAEVRLWRALDPLAAERPIDAGPGLEEEAGQRLEKEAAADAGRVAP